VPPINDISASSTYLLRLEVRFANALRRPLLFWNEKVVEKQLPKVATYGKSNFV